MVNTFNTEKEAHDKDKGDLEREIEQLKNDLAKEEKAQDTTPPENPEPQAQKDERKGEMDMTIRAKAGGTTRERLERMVQRDDVKNYLGEVRSAIKEKRAITNVGLTIPEVMLGLLRENVIDYSKLYRHVTVRSIRGEGRLLVMGAVPEAVWTECCANLNELTLGFNDVTVDCFKVAGYFAVCNANLEDSDLNLASELLSVLGQAIGIALDKAILYGRNSAATQNMPQGIIPRLLQTEQPANYPATARPWVNLSGTNVIIIPNTATGLELYKQMVIASGAAKGKYARGEKVWVMNETTYTAMVAEGMSVNAAGVIVTAVNGNMPVIGGVVEVLNFIPDNVILGGYFELYLLAERRGEQFATSEHVRFLQDQTVMKGTARYDGTPVIAEAFVLIGIKGTTPTASMTFASDTANPGE
jgi:HK97 family phage major capsid protein